MKRKLLITVCIVHTFIKVYSQENVLNSTKLKQFVFPNAPKEWFNYITKYLQLKLTKRHLNLKEITIFMKIKALTVDDEKPSFKKTIIVHPLGLVRSYRERDTSVIYYNKLPGRDLQDQFMIKIKIIMDKKLCLNLTFYHIHFGYRHLHTCSVGDIRLISHSKNEQVQITLYLSILGSVLFYKWWLL